MSFLAELRRRNVFRVGIAYVLIAWVALQGADFALDLVEAPNWVIQALFVLAGIGLPVTLAFAWAFELTPEGLKREAEVNRDTSITQTTGRRLDRLIIGALALAVVVLLVERSLPPGQDDPAATTAVEPAARAASGPPPSTTAVNAAAARSERGASIAVLPLANRSTDPQDAFFAEGIHDELLTQLSRISALRVISRTSVMVYENTDKRLPEIGRELGVSTLLEGGVQRAGDRVRINVQLIDAETDEHLWAEIYDRELTADNLFDIQSDITTSIADALRVVLTGAEKQSLDEKPTQNVEAYAAYLRARASAAYYGRNAPDIEEGIASYLRAIELDPGFAAAWAALSIDYSELHWSSASPTDESEKSLAALREAERLAPDSVETKVAAGYYHYWVNKDYAPAIASFDEALARNPASVNALRGRAYVLRRMGRLDDAIETFERALALDPLHGQMRADMAYSQLHAGHALDALASVRQADAIDGKTNFSRGVEAAILVVLDRLEEAWTLFDPTEPETSTFAIEDYLDVALLTRRPDRAETLLQVLDNAVVFETGPANAALMKARIYDFLGQAAKRDAALDAVEATLKEMSEQATTAEAREGVLLSRVGLHSLRGDADATRAAVAFLQETARPDALRAVDNGFVINNALARVGDFDAALDGIEGVIDDYGIWEFGKHARNPLYDPVRDTPRFQALLAGYEDWVAGQAP